MKRDFVRLSFMLAGAAFVGGCATMPQPDPRDPAPVKDSPQVLRVCYTEGDGAHLAVGDQIEISTNKFGRMRIRHIPNPENKNVWNEGKAVAVKKSILVETAPGNASKRQFVPVGRFDVHVPDQGNGHHAKFDFSQSKAVANLTNNRYPECNVALGADEVVIRGVKDTERHGGDSVAR